MPAVAAFWTISKLVRPDTIITRSDSGSRPASSSDPTSLSTALWRPTSSRTSTSSPDGSNSAAACNPPVRSNTRWAARSASGMPMIASGVTVRPSATGAQRTSIASSDALPQTPQLDVA